MRALRQASRVHTASIDYQTAWANMVSDRGPEFAARIEARVSSLTASSGLESPQVQQIIRTHTIPELARFDWDKIAFGFSTDEVITLPVSSLKYKYQLDRTEVLGKDMAAYFKQTPFDQLPPIEASFDKGKFWVEDGHHRLQYAKQLGLKEVPVKVEVRDNPFLILGFDMDDLARAKKELS